MSLPTGEWKANINGTETELTIGLPNQQGVFVGELFGIKLRGFWDEVSQTISFALTLTIEDDIPIVASFRGHLFRFPPNPEPGRDLIVSITGSFQMSAQMMVAAVGQFPAMGSSRRNVFGWLAQITEIQ